MYKCTNVQMSQKSLTIYYKIKLIDINQNNSLLFGLLTENVYNFIVFRRKTSLTITLHHFDSYAIPLRHKLYTTRTNDLHRFHCICSPTESR